MRKNKSTRPKKRRGRKQQPLEVEVEFIGGEEARRRWEQIFELLGKKVLQGGRRRVAGDLDIFFLSLC